MTALATRTPARFVGRGVSARRRRLVGAAVAAAALNLVVLLAQSRGLVEALYRNADSASGMVLAALPRDGGTISLGHYAYYEPWWLQSVTRDLPSYRFIWEAQPFALYALAVALVGWASYRAIGVVAAAIAVMLLLALGPAARENLLTPVTHGYVVVHAAILGAALVLVAGWADRARVPIWRIVALGVVVVAVTSLGATDRLFAYVALPSLVLSGCWTSWRTGLRRPAVAVFCVAVALLSLLGAYLISSAMRSSGIVSSNFPIAFLAPTSVLTNVQTMLVSIASLGGGYFFGTPVGRTQASIAVVGIVSVVAFAGILRTGWRHAGAAARRDASPDGPRDAFIAFWACIVVVSPAVVGLTDLPIDATASRYLPGVLVGTAALVGVIVAAREQRGTAVGAVAVAFAVLVAINHIVAGKPSYGVGPDLPTTAAIERFVTANGAQRGYAPYWDAATMTWQTRGRMRVFPAVPCGAGLCRPTVNENSAWYVPGSRRTFLVTDSRAAVPNTIPAPPAGLGTPAATASFGPFTVRVYPNDLAAAIAR